MRDLFIAVDGLDPPREAIAKGALLLRGKALPFEADLLAALDAITTEAPFRRMTTPGGFVMSVAMTNCGAAGWITDRTGYRYDHTTRKAVYRGRHCPIAFAISPALPQPTPAIPVSYRIPA
jgi:alkylated DNA repair dioxygenase AlkB